jgi:hypothetical protein
MWQHKPLRGGSPGPLLHHGTFHHSITPSLRAAGFEDEDDDEDEDEAPGLGQSSWRSAGSQ